MTLIIAGWIVKPLFVLLVAGALYFRRIWYHHISTSASGQAYIESEISHEERRQGKVSETKVESNVDGDPSACWRRTNCAATSSHDTLHPTSRELVVFDAYEYIGRNSPRRMRP